MPLRTITPPGATAPSNSDQVIPLVLDGSPIWPGHQPAGYIHGIRARAGGGCFGDFLGGELEGLEVGDEGAHFVAGCDFVIGAGAVACG